MNLFRKWLALALALCLCAAGIAALADGLDRPERFLGTWEGGEDYGETREYYLEILDYSDGVFEVALDIYRIWAFDGMTAILMEDSPSAALATAVDDEYSIMGTLDFSDSGIDLLVLESDYPDLPADALIHFEPSSLD